MSDTLRVAINGFGRIGRLVFRALDELPERVEIVAVNDLTTPQVMGHLLEFDSVHGRYPKTVRLADSHILVGDREVRVFAEKDPAKLPWRELGVDYVIESTGRFTDRKDAAKHIDAGAKRVILSAPGKASDVTLVRGVNLDAYDASKHFVISNASCTTNCLAPLLRVLDDRFGVEFAWMTTVHAFTNDQSLLDSPHTDLRRARAATLSMIPTSTGAAKAIHEVLPNLWGKVEGLAVRVPVPDASLVDLSVNLASPTSIEGVAQAFDAAARGPMHGILGVERRPLVSTDYADDRRSSIVDMPASMMAGDRRLKLLAWYSNEWAYSVRTAELCLDLWHAEDTGRIRSAVHLPVASAIPAGARP
ncbi:MAG: type I glyceraldehyde-3-phosphate dehydrogenase [Thermoplasmatota archaeon]